MTLRSAIAAAAVLAAFAEPALASESTAIAHVRIRNAAVRVVVVPEDRADVQVRVLKANPKLPIYVDSQGGATVIDGHLQPWFLRCRGHGQDFRVRTFDQGSFSYDELPQVVISTPRDVRIETGGPGGGGAVIGSVGRADALSLDLGACGDWTVANVAGALSVSVGGVGDVRAGSASSAQLAISGSGHVRTGQIRGELTGRVSGSGDVDVASTGRTDVSVSGSGDVRLGQVSGGLRAGITGSGDLRVQRLDGDFDASVSGVGDIKVAEGQVGAMRARISGSGDVSLGGTAQTLEAVISGRGDVTVRAVSGNVDKRISGAGEVHIGP